MNVDFYTANEQNAPTVENFLFTDQYAAIFNGQKIEHRGEIYQVTGQLWNDEHRKLLNVFLWKYPQPV